jgi:predicted nucleic acid-binding protein
LRQYLLNITRRGFGIVISDVSTYELLSGATVRQEQQANEILSDFIRYSVDSGALITASQLSTVYKKEKISEQSITLADKIIGATAILTGSLIMTADVNDYPRPFFTEAEEKLFYYKRKNKTCMRVVQLLRPNLPVMQQRFSERPKN